MKNKILFCLVSAVIVSLILSSLLFAGFMKPASDRLSNALYSESPQFSEIIIVGIDDKSIGSIGRWPWSRDVFAKALGKLNSSKVVGFDVSFLEKENNETDSSFQAAINSMKEKVILVSECSEFQGTSCSKWNDPIFSSETGAANVYDENGITNSVPSSIGGKESFSRRIAEIYLNRNVTMEDKSYIRFSKFQIMSFSDLLSSNQSFDGKIVLIGATAKDLHDFKETPIGTLSGVEVHASAVQTEITNSFLSMQSKSSVILWMFILSMLVGLFLWKFRLLPASVLSLLLAIIYPLISLFRFDSGTVYNLPYPEAAIILTYFAIIGAYYLIEARQRKWISNVLGKYVSDSVAKEIMEKGEEALNLKGSKKVITVLFADIRGFTSMSEKMKPEEVVEFLNKYLSKMTDIVFENNGTLDKYVGDEIMATYNVPLDLQDHALHAVKTAIGMQKASKHLENLKYGIGINTGDAIVGNIGSSKRLDYTVIGDSVNLGARLCGKAEAHQILISESTNELVKDKIKSKSIGEIMVKGKEKPIKVFEVVY